MNSTVVRWAGVRPAANTSETATSKEPGRSRSSTSRASPTRIRTRAPRSGSLSRTRLTSAASTSTATCGEPGRVAAT